MRISDWSSDVCSSDLAQARRGIAIAGDIMGRPFGVEQPRELLDEVRIGAFDREAHAVLRADAAIDGEMTEARPCGADLVERGGIGVRALDQAVPPAHRLAPFERENRILDRDRKSVVEGRSVSEGVARGGSSSLTKKKS